MKKLFFIILATVLCAGLAIPASAFENEFGGYWRTRAYSTYNGDGQDSGSKAMVDTRTRLYYTAKFSDNFKFVNKFEFNTTWGDNNGGDTGADGTGILRIKNSYIDFNTGPMNFKVGTQGGTIARGFLFSDDFSGLVAKYNAGKNSFSASWIKVDDDSIKAAQTGTVASNLDGDPDTENNDVLVQLDDETQNERDYYILSGVLNLSDTLSMSPFLFLDKEETTDTAVYSIGTDLDVKMDNASLWSTLIYQTGETEKKDNEGFLIAVGGNAGVIHGQFFYATGDDDISDNKAKAFALPAGRSYYWSEILGFGIFDNPTGFGTSPNDAITNVMAANIGTTLKPTEKLTVSADLWYAQLAEDAIFKPEVGSTEKSKDLGIEVDLKATYKILDNLKLDLVAAYLIAGDAVGTVDNNKTADNEAAVNDKDVSEFGARLSFSF